MLGGELIEPVLDVADIQQTTEAGTVQEVAPFWQEQITYFRDYTVFMTICFAILAGLLCVLIFRR